MADIIVMPKLGLTMKEGKITKWLKQEGDAVAKGDELYEVETDKLTNTVEAVNGGTLLKIFVFAGETVPCMEPVAAIGQPGEQVEVPTKDDISDAAATRAPGAAVDASTVTVAAQTAAAATDGGRIIAAPAARKLAVENGIDLAIVVGSGPGGRITIKDVEAVLAVGSASQDAATGTGVKSTGLAAKLAADIGMELAAVPADGRIRAADVRAFAASGAGGDEPVQLEERVEMNGMRRVIAERMRASREISPSVSFNVSVDTTALGDLRKQLKNSDIKVSYTDLLALCVSRVLMQNPALNCSVEGNAIVYKHYVNLGIAVALEDGLLVPVVRNAHLKGLAALSAEIRELAEAARQGAISPDALSGGTFTITNLGNFGIESFSPIINQPEVAILGVNAITDTVVVENGQQVIRPMMGLSLVADHRAVDGAVAARFLAQLKKYIQQPALLLY
jgi:pyruvate dehydrogenase E2 component (dihydrolipoamide acetyltransferase)